jgi:GAG-pre-integrase domain
MYTVLYHVLVLVLQKIGNNIQLGLHMFLYSTFCLPLVLAYLHNPMSTRRNLNVHLRRNKKWYSVNIDWYAVFTRILDNAIFLLPMFLTHMTSPCSMYISTGTSRAYKRSTTTCSKRHKTKRLRSRYYTLPILFASYVTGVSSIQIDTGTTNGTSVGSNTNRHVKPKFRRKCNNIKCLRYIIANNNQQKQHHSSLHDHKHQKCFTTNLQHHDNNVKKPCPMIFDSDSVPIRVDNCCSRTLSGSLHDFDKSTLIPTENDLTIKGFGGTETQITHTGTIIWHIHDDHGITRKIRIPHSFYIPTTKHRLLSPQHWAQESCVDNPNDNSTWCATHKDRVILYWNRGTHRRTIHIDKDGSNTAILWTVPGINRFESYMSNAQQQLCLSSETSTVEPTTDQLMYQHTPMETENVPTNLIDFEIDDNHCEPSSMSQEEELMQWHQRLCHMPMKRIQNLAVKGILPRRLSKCKIPLCPACVFGKMTRRRWRTSSTENTITPEGCDVGGMVSVDQIQSSTPGIIAQMKGIPTGRRYHIATVYVDHKSDYTYVHLQQSTSSEETLQSKHSFERWAKSCNVTIKRYHSDNGRFVDTAWINDAENQGQIVSMCGAYAHHQNGKWSVA